MARSLFVFWHNILTFRVTIGKVNIFNDTTSDLKSFQKHTHTNALISLALIIAVQEENTVPVSFPSLQNCSSSSPLIAGLSPAPNSNSKMSPNCLVLPSPLIFNICITALNNIEACHLTVTCASYLPVNFTFHNNHSMFPVRLRRLLLYSFKYFPLFFSYY